MNSAHEAELSEIAARIENYEVQEANLVQQLAEIRVALRQERAKAAGIVNLSAPVSALPNEILSNIFEAGLATSYTLKHRVAFPLLVAQISRQWRTVAFNTPSLWATVTGLLPQAQIWVERAKARPLDMHLDVVSKVSPLPQYFYDYINSMFDLLTPHALRWRTLAVHLSKYGEHLRVMDRIHGLYAPELERLAISLQPDHGTLFGPPVQVTRTVFSQGCPRLLDLRLEGIRVQDVIVPNCQSLTTLHCCGNSDASLHKFAAFKDALSSLPQLVNLLLKGEFADIPPDLSHVGRIILPNLRVLMIDRPAPGEAVPVITCLRMPSLECLAVTNLDGEAPDVLTTLAAEHEDYGYFGKLRCLRLWSSYRSYARGPEPATLSFAIPAVSDFTLVDDDSWVFVDAISRTQDLVWPQLRTLTISAPVDEYGVRWAGRDLIQDVLVNFLEDRLARGPGIEKLRLHRSVVEETPAEIMEQLDELVEVETLDTLYSDWDDLVEYGVAALRRDGGAL